MAYEIVFFDKISKTMIEHRGGIATRDEAVSLVKEEMDLHMVRGDSLVWSKSGDVDVGEIVDAYGVPADAVKHEIAPESVVFPKEEVK